MQPRYSRFVTVTVFKRFGRGYKPRPASVMGLKPSRGRIAHYLVKENERDAGGSIILHWRVSEIEDVIVPIVDMSTQTQIAALVQQSFILKAESEHLLEIAKRAVEIAIETDEQTALDYINEQTGE